MGAKDGFRAWLHERLLGVHEARQVHQRETQPHTRGTINAEATYARHPVRAAHWRVVLWVHDVHESTNACRVSHACLPSNACLLRLHPSTCSYTGAVRSLPSWAFFPSYGRGQPTSNQSQPSQSHQAAAPATPYKAEGSTQEESSEPEEKPNPRQEA